MKLITPLIDRLQSGLRTRTPSPESTESPGEPVHDQDNITVTATEAVLLSLLSELDGELRGKQRLQKLAFLVDDELGDAASLYSWVKYDYGPYAKQITHDTRSLESNDLISIRKKPTFGGGTRYSYRLTSDGDTVISWIYEKHGAFDTVTDVTRDVVAEHGETPISNLIQEVRDEHPVYWENSVYRS